MKPIIRCTTPTHVFHLPKLDYDEIRVNYKQGGELVLVKHGADLRIEETDETVDVFVDLSQSDTKAFVADRDVEFDVDALLTTGKRWNSGTFVRDVADVLNDEVM